MSYDGSAIITLPIDSSKEYRKFDSRVSFVNRYMKVAPMEVCERIIASFGPPFTQRFRKRDADLVGPVAAMFFLIAILHYGYSAKDPSATNTTMAPITAVVSYALLNPCVGFLLCKLARANIVFWDLTALLGYTLYSHILTLSLSLLIYQEESNAFFFLCLFIFGGLSALRMCLILITTIPKPAARLLVCSTLFISHLLYLIYLHFAYMHPTFVYGAGNRRN